MAGYIASKINETWETQISGELSFPTFTVLEPSLVRWHCPHLVWVFTPRVIWSWKFLTDMSRDCLLENLISYQVGNQYIIIRIPLLPTYHWNINLKTIFCTHSLIAISYTESSPSVKVTQHFSSFNPFRTLSAESSQGLGNSLTETA